MIGCNGVSGVENSISALTALVIEMDPRETGCEDGRGMGPLRNLLIKLEGGGGGKINHGY
jgi:hypothetical protein